MENQNFTGSALDDLENETFKHKEVVHSGDAISLNETPSNHRNNIKREKGHSNELLHTRQ